jgi:hypothetical protein
MRSSILLALIFLAAACGHAPRVREYLDESTAATITASEQGWIFARERSDLAVHARDYITITPVLVNRGGTRVMYLYCQLWSTIDWRRDKSLVAAKNELALLADDRRLPLISAADTLRQLGFGHSPVDTSSQTEDLRVVRIDADFLRFMVNASQLRIAVSQGDVSHYYSLWKSGRDDARVFIDATDR